MFTLAAIFASHHSSRYRFVTRGRFYLELELVAMVTQASTILAAQKTLTRSVFSTNQITSLLICVKLNSTHFLLPMSSQPPVAINL